MMDSLDCISELVDLGFHCREQGIKLDVIKAYSFYYNVHREIFGSFAGKDHYEAHMSNRYRYIIENTYNLVEKKIEMGKIDDPYLFLVA